MHSKAELHPTRLSRREACRLGFALTGGTALAKLVRADTPPPALTKAVKTTNGPMQGLMHEGIQVFKGIRYAAPPTGARRFLPPQKPEPWKDTADATEFGAPAMQMPFGAILAPPSEFAWQLATVFPTLAEMKIANEDCLFLNVWSPSLEGAKRPVLVWLHGGGFAFGSGAWPVYDGTNLARKGDAVVVTVNHRLNVFGYLYAGEGASDSYAQSGNAGMLDLVAALEWVRDNIQAFGGDPANVTIFGESGGGAKVCTLMAMPSAKGLFHKAIVQSGPSLKGVTKEAAIHTAKGLMSRLQVADAKGLQCIPAADLVDAAYGSGSRTSIMSMRTIGRFAPVVDGIALPADPFTPAAPAMSASVPLLIGTNKDEMTLFTATEPWFGKLTDAQLNGQGKMVGGPHSDEVIAALRKAYPDYSPTYLMAALITSTTMLSGSFTIAERKVSQKSAPVYMYRLVWETSVAGGALKCPHALDLPLVFDNVEKARAFVGTGPAPQTVADQMSAAWLAFARAGDPNAKGLPRWPPYTTEKRATMLFDVHSSVADDPEPEVRKALES